jgi:hypothetical protein
MDERKKKRTRKRKIKFTQERKKKKKKVRRDEKENHIVSEGKEESIYKFRQIHSLIH